MEKDGYNKCQFVVQVFGLATTMLRET